MPSYLELLTQMTSSPYGQQLFNIHFHTVLQHTLDKSTVEFSQPRRLLSIGPREFLYGSVEETLSFTAPLDATHIYYDTTGEPDVLTLPLMLKIDGSSFEVLTSRGWIPFSYPIEGTSINLELLYKL